MTIDYDKILVLYLEHLTGTISPEDAVLLRQKLHTDGSVKQIWEQLEREGQTPEMEQFLKNLDPEMELRSLKERMQPVLPVKTSGGRTIRRMLSVAAALLVLVFGTYYLFKEKKITDTGAIASLIRENRNAVSLRLGSGESIDLNRAPEAMQMGQTVLNLDSNSLNFRSADTAVNLLSIPRGENYTLHLSDGTVVTLNADSKLRFPFRFWGQTRDVYLEGEAYFKVAKDHKHPFIVHTPLTEVEVVGTEFNVNTYKAGTVSTALIEGKVLTGTPGGATQPLLPGHAAVYNTSRGFKIEEVDTDDVAAWVKGVYYFHDLPFHELVTMMARSYGVAISVDNSALSGKSVSGVMDKNNLPELLEDLKTTVGIKYHYSGHTLHIY
ncbi:FecR domain-containing protein [Niabella pedocola]|uniref:FecR domain-containing protein n=1 Tax=Niabella pedocola TaxID=1752077 RepID=A0ABS8PXK3_9BACT|nr:FecR domain-containing protein [Niabella pedocola]MCD2425799.1 FecR domain-containing protein [Niabella pedocola]